MSTKLEWSKTGLKLKFDVSAQASPRVQQVYPIPDLPIQSVQFLSASLEQAAETGRTGIRLTSLDVFPGNPSALFSIVHVATPGDTEASEELSLTGNTCNIYLDQPLPNATHTFALKRIDAGQTITWPSVSVTTPSDPTQAAISQIQDTIEAWGSDGILSTSEKASVITTYTGLSSQVTTLRAQATSVGATLPTQNTLTTYLASLGPYPWTDMAHNTAIPDPAIWKAQWQTIYTEIASLTAAIAAKLNAGVSAASGVAVWGGIGGTLANQTDLQNALNAKANLSGAIFTGDLSSATGVNIGSDTRGASTFVVTNAAAGQVRGLRVRTASVDRWILGGAGDDSFGLWAYTDAGSYGDRPLTIDRTTGGAFTISRPLVVTSSVKSTMANAYLQVAGNKAGGNVWAMQTADDTGRWRLFDTTSGKEAVAVAQSTLAATFYGAMTVAGGDFAHTGSGLSYFGSGTSGYDLRIRGAAGQQRILSFRTGNALRWAFYVDGVAEGSNAGSSIHLASYADDGTTWIDDPLVIPRAAGAVITISRPATIGGVPIGGSSSGPGIRVNATQGLVLQGSAGSSYDLAFINPAGTAYLGYVPTGTTNLTWSGNLTTWGLYPTFISASQWVGVTGQLYANNTADTTGAGTGSFVCYGGGAFSKGLSVAGAAAFGSTVTTANNLTMGAATTGSVGIELGNTSGTATTPYLDFHSSGNPVDYDVRLIASGGTTSAGGGSLTVTAQGGIVLNGTTIISKSTTFQDCLFISVTGYPQNNSAVIKSNWADSNNVGLTFQFRQGGTLYDGLTLNYLGTVNIPNALTVAGSATVTGQLSSAVNRLGLGTYAGNDADTFATRNAKGTHFGRVKASADCPGGDTSGYYNYLQMPEVIGNYNHTILATQVANGRTFIGYGANNAAPTWAEVYTTQNINTSLAATQALLALQSAPQWVTALPSLPSSNYPAGCYVCITGTKAVYQNQSGAWVQVASDAVIFGQVTAGSIAAQSIGATALAAEIALATTIRSKTYTAGSSTSAPAGFFLTGVPFTSHTLVGDLPGCVAELGGNANWGGYPLSSLALAKLYYGQNGQTRFTTPGTATWTAPAMGGATSYYIMVTLCGAGGGGAGSDFIGYSGYSIANASGGGGGGSLRKRVLVSPGQVLTFSVPVGGTGGNRGVGSDGGDCVVTAPATAYAPAISLTAKGGKGGKIGAGGAGGESVSGAADGCAGATASAAAVNSVTKNGFTIDRQCPGAGGGFAGTYGAGGSADNGGQAGGASGTSGGGGASAFGPGAPGTSGSGAGTSPVGVAPALTYGGGGSGGAAGAYTDKSVSGSPSISVNGATGNFVRSTGSFVTDGFVVGGRLYSSGFGNSANNGNWIISAVSATSVTVDADLVTESGSTARALTCRIPTDYPGGQGAPGFAMIEFA